MIELEGIVESIVYKSDDSGFTVAKLQNGNEIISIVGYVPFLTEGQRVCATGEWVMHKNFGQQFKIESLKEIMPSTLDGIEKYLSSGLIPGIGPKTAKKIVEKFGLDTLSVIDMNYLRITEIEGIGEKKARGIKEAFDEQRELREVMVFLQGHGISATYGVKIFKRYGNNTIQNVRENPYRLCDDIFGIGFKTADRIARNLGISFSSQDRIKAGIRYLLQSLTSNGHTYMPKPLLIKEGIKLLGVDEDSIDNGITSLILDKKLVAEEAEGYTNIYLTYLYYAEIGSAKKIVEISLSGYTFKMPDVSVDIEEFERERGITLASEQKDAVIEGVKNGFCVITGGPGTGKTTIIKCMIKVFERLNMSVILAAPTGRAAKRITETTGYEAKTIHRLLEMEYMSDEENPAFARDEDNPLEADAIIIDEASMIDISLMYSLLKAVSTGTKLIMVGDVDQLPSVGPGNVLRDIIESGPISVVRLKAIYRQAEESLITVNAHRINNGEIPMLNEREKDFFFIQKINPPDIVDEIVELLGVRLLNYKRDLVPIKDIQVLSPSRKGEVGVDSLNIRLQNVLNPPSPLKEEKHFKEYSLRVGDKVMQIKNNYNLEWKRTTNDGEEKGSGVFNGDIGFITDIDNENQRLTVAFDDERRVNYDFSTLDELELAYAVTVHKSQGSEFRVVIIPLFFGPPMLMTRNLIYTAVTRAKELLIMVGSKQSLFSMISNNMITKRYSSLGKRINSAYSTFK